MVNAAEGVTKFTDRNTIVVISTEQDSTIRDVANATLADDYDKKIDKMSVDTIEALETSILNAKYAVVYVGHGTPEGLQVGAEIIPWDRLDEMVTLSEAKSHLFATCFSDILMYTNDTNNMRVGFHEYVDVQVAELVIKSILHGLSGEKEIAMQYLDQIFSPEISSLILEPSKVLGWGPYDHNYLTDVAFTTAITYGAPAAIPIVIAIIITITFTAPNPAWIAAAIIALEILFEFSTNYIGV